jgi:hypothetical protein
VFSSIHLSLAHGIERGAKMLDGGKSMVIGPDNRHHVEPAFLFEQSMFLEKMQRRESEPPLLLWRHRLGRVPSSPSFDLDEHDRVSIARHKIDLTLRSPVSSQDHSHLRSTEKARGGTLAPVAEPSTQYSTQNRRPGRARGTIIVRR